MRWLFGAGFYFLFFTMGVLLTEYHLDKTGYHWEENKGFYRVQLTDKPTEKEKTILCPIVVQTKQDSTGDVFINKRIVLYLTKNSLSKKLHRGDNLLLYTQIKSPQNNGNPEEFDYASYLIHQGVSGTAFAYTDNWKLIGRESSPSLKQKALDCRESMLVLFKKIGFKGDEYTVLSALVLGYQEELSDEIKESYSISGASHVLSLSGLHIGFLYVLLAFVLGRTDNRKRTLLFKQIVIILAMWSFAFITGLLSPVVRSVIMFSLMALAKATGGRPVTLNTLAVAAFLMLCYNPFYLYDVSFQLSFVAMASILIIQPWLYDKIKVENKILKYIWGLMSVSLAAQIGTSPIVIYYFSRFSTHFLLTNLLVIPLVSIIMYLAVIMLVFTFLPLIQHYLALLLMYSIQLLNGITEGVEHLPFSSINHIWLCSADVLGFYLILTFGAMYLVRRNRKSLLVSLCLLLGLCSYHAIHNYNQQRISSIIFYNTRNYPAVHFIESRQESYLVAAQSSKSVDKLRNITERFWNKLNLDTPVTVEVDYNKNSFWKRKDVMSFHGQTVCMIKDDNWRNKEAGNPLTIDYLYLCKGYSGRLAWLMNLFTVKKVILDSSLGDYRRETFEGECKELGLDYISLSEKGSFFIRL